MSNNVLNPTREILTLTNANTQYSWTPPANVGYFSVQARTSADVRVATVTGKVATPTDPYGTIKAGQVFNSPERMILPPGTIFYFATGTAGTILEIEYWLQVS